ncbi:MAG: hypothetical protein ACLR8Y_07715 [Alistipes indistinctus]
MLVNTAIAVAQDPWRWPAPSAWPSRRAVPHSKRNSRRSAAPHTPPARSSRCWTTC